MARRIRVGIIFNYNENWIGGTYYILNLIKALDLLPDDKKPQIVLISEAESSFESGSKIGYPYLSFQKVERDEFKPNLSQRIANKVSQTFFGKIAYESPFLNPADIDILFPFKNISFFRKIKNRLFWIPDFQEKHLPEFFTEELIRKRYNRRKFLANSDNQVVFSSKDALNDFKELFPTCKANTNLLRFAVSHPSYQSLDFPELLKKYKINGPYFFCPNQLWKHKNHRVVLEMLKKRGEKVGEFMVLFSGKETDPRNPTYPDEIFQMVKDYGLENNVKFLGFIDRGHQLKLMSEAVAIIQPSLFEGWSTVVEDAKSMNQFVLASDISIHQEQITENVLYFDPKDADDLLKKVETIFYQPVEKKSFDYSKNIQAFGEDFLKIVNRTLSQNA